MSSADILTRHSRKYTGETHFYQQAQYQAGKAKWNAAVINATNNTCALPAMTCQNAVK